MKREPVIASIYGSAFTIVLAVLIYFGSRNLSHFDAALVGYTFAVLFATFGIVYRYAMWLQRPPTAICWKRGWRPSLIQNISLQISSTQLNVSPAIALKLYF